MALHHYCNKLVYRISQYTFRSPCAKYLCPCWCAAADLVCSVCQIVSSLCCRGRGWPAAVFARVAASWCDALTCILYLHVLATFCLWSAISSGTVDRDQVPVQLLILIILISTFTSSILCYTLTLDGNKQCYCWYVVWMGISLWLWCMTSSSWSGINHISTFIISVISFCLLATSFQILVSLTSDCEYLDWEASKFCLGKQFSDVEH